MDFLKLFLIAIMAAIVGLMGYLLFIAVDSIGVQSSPTSATVIGKDYRPAYTTTTMVSNGNGGLTPIVTYHPESWAVAVRYAEGSIWCPASKAQYNAARDGQNTIAFIKAGRLSGSAYCDGVR